MIIGDVMQMRVTRSVALDDEFKPEPRSAGDGRRRTAATAASGCRATGTQHANPSQWLLDKVVTELHLSPDQVYEMPANSTTATS